jgi:hypothetical protein
VSRSLLAEVAQAIGQALGRGLVVHEVAQRLNDVGPGLRPSPALRDGRRKLLNAGSDPPVLTILIEDGQLLSLFAIGYCHRTFTVPDIGVFAVRT